MIVAFQISSARCRVPRLGNCLLDVPHGAVAAEVGEGFLVAAAFEVVAEVAGKDFSVRGEEAVEFADGLSGRQCSHGVSGGDTAARFDQGDEGGFDFRMWAHLAAFWLES